MKKALIEIATRRLCQVEPVNPEPESGGIPFPVSSGLEWRDCADDVKPETHQFDGVIFSLIPAPPPEPSPSPTELEAICIAGASTPPPPRFGFDLHRAFIAHVISTEAYRLGVAPGLLTGAQLTAIRNRIAAIYKAL